MSNLSGTITASNTAQDLASFDPRRRAFMIQNLGASGDDMWIRFGADSAEASPSFKVTGAQVIFFGREWAELICQRISVIGTMNDVFTAYSSSV